MAGQERQKKEGGNLCDSIPRKVDARMAAKYVFRKENGLASKLRKD